MNIFLVSYGDVNYDGRLRSLLSVFEKIGDVQSFTRGSRSEVGRHICNERYGRFIIKCIAFGKKLKDIDILVLDNRKATIPGLLLKQILKPRYVIQDCRELYLIKEVKHFSGKVGCLFEKMMVKIADIVICANQERAQIMQKEYKLKDTPLTYENLRKLEYPSDIEMEKLKAKFEPYIKDDEVRIISSSGCSIKRTNDILVKNLRNVNKKCRLFLVGNSESGEEQIIRNLASEDKRNEVTIFGQLNQAELKYLISQCQIGIVNYGQYDTNNRLCASGKLYEFLYEGLPVVTTTNPPLVRICEVENVGIGDGSYFSGINTILDQYEEFCNSVKVFAKKHTVSENDEMLISSLLKKMNT